MKGLEDNIVYDSDHRDLFATEFKTVGSSHPSWRVYHSDKGYSVCRVLWDVYKDEESQETVATFQTLEEAVEYIPNLNQNADF